uniref:Uncharacterized protein n=1 Tax=Heterorhabditis bacteriophora TaxID=37862 RepID=A0A1I7WXH9_HETBA
MNPLNYYCHRVHVKAPKVNTAHEASGNRALDRLRRQTEGQHNNAGSCHSFRSQLSYRLLSVLICPESFVVSSSLVSPNEPHVATNYKIQQ